MKLWIVASLLLVSFVTYASAQCVPIIDTVATRDVVLRGDLTATFRTYVNTGLDADWMFVSTVAPDTDFGTLTVWGGKATGQPCLGTDAEQLWGPFAYSSTQLPPSFFSFTKDMTFQFKVQAGETGANQTIDYAVQYFSDSDGNNATQWGQLTNLADPCDGGQTVDEFPFTISMEDIESGKFCGWELIPPSGEKITFEIDVELVGQDTFQAWDYSNYKTVGNLFYENDKSTSENVTSSTNGKVFILLYTGPSSTRRSGDNNNNNDLTKRANSRVSVKATSKKSGGDGGDGGDGSDAAAMPRISASVLLVAVFLLSAVSLLLF
eukprot:TRINITY_DN5595_c0_g1_i1.p1 TRINITY_DN5595_c0_g1~~TRINITY_DN5595_c0_g1_i1.p1  ORF type:complete len:343 (-),score=68.17 TRINITY_DN5595_c0_g1_i1:84-1049(-)